MSGPERIRAVVFDFGGVLITPITRTFELLARSLDIDGSTLREIVMGPLDRTTDHPWHLAEQGRLPVVDIQERLPPHAAVHGVDLAGDEMDRLLEEDHFDLNTVVVERVRTLRSEGYLVGLLTNTFVEFRPTLERVLDLSMFDVVAESSAIGARKPDAAAYAAVLDGLGVPAAQTVFLDDFGPNVSAAAAVGMQTVHVVDPVAAIGELDEMLQEASR